MRYLALLRFAIAVLCFAWQYAAWHYYTLPLLNHDWPCSVTLRLCFAQIDIVTPRPGSAVCCPALPLLYVAIPNCALQLLRSEKPNIAFALLCHASLRLCMAVFDLAIAVLCVALPLRGRVSPCHTMPLLCRDIPGSTKTCAAFALLCGTSPCCRRALHSRCFAEHSSTVLLPRPTKLRFTTPLLCDTYTTSHRFALLLLCSATPRWA